MPAPDTVDSARERMLATIAPLGSEQVPLADASGRTLAEPVLAARDQPPFRSSAMDGYALRSADLALGQFTVVGQSAAGSAHEGAMGSGEAVRIFTGAPVPDSADLVVPQERARRDDTHVFIDASIKPDKNIRDTGIDFTAGATLIAAGTALHGRHVALLAAAGIASAKVSRVPRVALLATGTEILTPGRAAGPYQIYDSVTFGLGAMVQAWGGRPVRGAASPDDDEAVLSAIDEALSHADLVVVVGGASVGDYDIVKSALAVRALKIDVSKVSMRPGQPTWFGSVGGKPILGLPGNPAAAFVCAYLFLRPLLDAFLARVPSLRFVPAVLEGNLSKSGDFERYWRAVVRIGDDARVMALPFDNQDTSLVSIFAASNALIRTLAGARPAEHGAIVEVMLLDGG